MIPEASIDLGGAAGTEVLDHHEEHGVGFLTGWRWELLRECCLSRPGI